MVPLPSAPAAPAARTPLAAAHWPSTAYARTALPVRVLQFGTGMLLRALATHAIDAANRAGRGAGRIAVVQSTARGVGEQLRAQDGLFTVLERGSVEGRLVDRATLVGAVGPVYSASHDWEAIEAVAASPDLRAIISNVTETGFQLDPDDLTRIAQGEPPLGFPARLTRLLAARARRLGDDAPPLVVIPTELLDDNGPRLAAMVATVVERLDPTGALASWIASHVRFASSLVDRITTGDPAPGERDALAERLGYADAVVTVTEPYSLWAIEGDAALLRDALPIDVGARVVFAPDIAPLRDRKLRLLNGLHTAVAPVALLAGLDTVLEAVHHPTVGPFMRRLLFDELMPVAPIAAHDAERFAHAVLDRFANPWLEHAWHVIAGNQLLKTRHRLVPTVCDAAALGLATPQLALAWGAMLHWAAMHPEPPAALAPLTALVRGAPTAESAVARALAQTEWWGASLATNDVMQQGAAHALRRLSGGSRITDLLAESAA
ncbi:MAG: hypothetical protein MUF00_01035 [Gemmatimonadaceae bacterium]|jgi:tagaturonate reductase|nr:hypothetical protein [Gemmatimonadaceae bacterium]